MTDPTISFVVCTYRSYTHKYGCIELTLAAIDQQKNIEIVVVENSGDGVDREQLKLYLATYNFKNPIKMIEEYVPVGNGRNAGARAASGDIIVFMDDDVFLTTPDAADQVRNAIDTYAHGYGATRPWTRELSWFSSNRDRLLGEFLQSDFLFLLTNTVKPLPKMRSLPDTAAEYLSRSYIASFGYVTRTLFEKTGGYPENFEHKLGSEDSALMLKCYLADGAPASLKDITIVHLNHPLRYDNMTEVEYDSYSKHNEKLFLQYCITQGIAGFNPYNLMFPESPRAAPVILTIEEYLAQKN